MSIPDLLARLTESRRAGVFHLAQTALSEIEGASESDGYLWARLDLSGVSGKSELLRQLAASFEFPDTFGHNWDALYDSLTDLSWNPAPGYVLLLEGYDTLRGNAREDFDTALGILGEAAEHWRADDTPFWTLLPLPRQGAPFLPMFA